MEKFGMHTLFTLLLLTSGFVILACAVLLHWRALQDGAFQDVLLTLTGISLAYYVGRRWDRAKGPIRGMIGAAVVLAVVIGVSGGVGSPPREPSPEEVAAEVKPLILQEWKKSPGLENATIQSISLVHKGGGQYAGFVEARRDGQPERLALEVVLDRETIRWEIKPATN